MLVIIDITLKYGQEVHEERLNKAFSSENLVWVRILPVYK